MELEELVCIFFNVTCVFLYVMFVFNIDEVYFSLYCVYFNLSKRKKKIWPTTPEILVPTDTPEMWCRGISGAMELFADVAAKKATAPSHGTNGTQCSKNACKLQFEYVPF